MAKREGSSLPLPVSKKKTKSTLAQGFKDISEIYKSFKKDHKNLNGLLVILKIFKEESTEDELSSVACQAISNIFLTLLKEQVFTPNRKPIDGESETAKGKVASWLNTIFAEFKSQCILLLNTIGREEIGFNAMMQILRLESVNFIGEFTFPIETLSIIVERVLTAQNDDFFFLFDEAVNSYRDIRFYTIRILTRSSDRLKTLAKTTESQNIAKSIFKILSEIEMEDEGEELKPLFLDQSASNSVSSVKGHQQEFSSCWLEFLQGMTRIAPELHRPFLLIVNERVIPYLTKPTLLSDYLTDSFNDGGLVSLLALNGLFTLIHKHNLDYPSFFTKLYSILDSKILHCRYRKRFLRLFALFMTSTHMPAYLVAAFVKKIARLSLDASPAVITWVVPFIYNMFKSHPAIRVLINRQSDLSAKEALFSMAEHDPAKCKAIDSSLWEIQALSRHYWTGSAKLARLFSERLTKPPFNLEEFLDGPTYSHLIQQELSHKWTKLPPLNIKISSHLFQ